jgi:hypothetical protein
MNVTGDQTENPSWREKWDFGRSFDLQLDITMDWFSWLWWSQQQQGFNTYPLICHIKRGSQLQDYLPLAHAS